jgi:hypothetical protein
VPAGVPGVGGRVYHAPGVALGFWFDLFGKTQRPGQNPTPNRAGVNPGPYGRCRAKRQIGSFQAIMAVYIGLQRRDNASTSSSA